MRVPAQPCAPKHPDPIKMGVWWGEGWDNAPCGTRGVRWRCAGTHPRWGLGVLLGHWQRFWASRGAGGVSMGLVWFGVRKQRGQHPLYLLQHPFWGSPSPRLELVSFPPSAL